MELGGLDAKLTAAAVVNENEISHLKRASSISYNWVLTAEYVPRIIVNERFYSPRLQTATESSPTFSSAHATMMNVVPLSSPT